MEHPRPASRLDVEPKNAGVAGAKMGIDENNAGGRFTGHLYSLDTETASSPEEALAALEKFQASGHNYVIVDASAPTLLKLADWAKDKDVLLFNISATDVSLRQDDCRANVMHIVPDRYMLADALAQYLVAMDWKNWLLVHGSTPADLAYAEAVKRAAGRFGGNIVDVREYKDVSGGRRDDVGVIPPAIPGKQANADKTVVAAAPTTTSSSSPTRTSSSARSCPIAAAAIRGPWPAPPGSRPRPGAPATRNGARPRPTTISRRPFTG